MRKKKNRRLKEAEQKNKTCIESFGLMRSKVANEESYGEKRGNGQPKLKSLSRQKPKRALLRRPTCLTCAPFGE